jgi:hypothetical protein
MRLVHERNVELSLKLRCLLIFLKSTATTIQGIPTDVNQWSLINPKQKAFYRVNYDDANRAAIVSQLLTDHTVSRNYLALA